MKTMFLDLLQLYVMYKVVVWSFKLLTNRKNYGKNRKGRSIADKIIMLGANNIHYRLDARLKAQRLAAMKPQAVNRDNVVLFKRKA